MFARLVLLFTLVPLIELILLFRIAEVTGWEFTLALVVATGLAGAYLAKSQGRQILGKIRTELSEGRLPGEELVNGLCVLVGGALLLTPGILTDITGFILVIPFSRNLIKKYLRKKFEGMIRSGRADIYYG